MTTKFPMQPIYVDGHGVVRFMKNTIVKRLLDEGGIDLNQIAKWDVTDEERMQFAQLIGYSVSGFGDLFPEHPDVVAEADRRAIEARWEPS